VSIKGKNLEAGLVVLMATVLQRHSPDHHAVEDASQWLIRNDYERYSDKLTISPETPHKKMSGA
jgi:hypothetical protein